MSRKSSLSTLLAVGIVVLLGAAVVVTRVTGDRQDSDGVSAQLPARSQQPPAAPPGGVTRAADVSNPDAPTYPKSEEVQSVAEAIQKTGLDFIMPDDPLANSGNVDHVWVLTPQAVAVDFPSPAVPQKYLRQNYIEVYEGTWPADENPLATYKHDLSSDPSPAKSLILLDGTPVLTVEAHSPHDDQQANPAFLRFVTRGVEVQVSGGESLDSLIRIAKTILSDTGSSPESPANAEP